MNRKSGTFTYFYLTKSKMNSSSAIRIKPLISLLTLILFEVTSVLMDSYDQRLTEGLQRLNWSHHNTTVIPPSWNTTATKTARLNYTQAESNVWICGTHAGHKPESCKARWTSVVREIWGGPLACCSSTVSRLHEKLFQRFSTESFWTSGSDTPFSMESPKTTLQIKNIGYVYETYSHNSDFFMHSLL